MSENLHWAPFFEVAFRYFRNTYTTQFVGNEDAERLLVFLLGMTSHHVMRKIGSRLAIDINIMTRMQDLGMYRFGNI